MRDQLYFCCGRLTLKKQESDSCFILQATPDILACSGSVWVVILPVLNIVFISLSLSRDFTSKNVSKEDNRIILRVHQSEAVNILKMKLLWMKVKLGGGVGGGGADKN